MNDKTLKYGVVGVKQDGEEVAWYTTTSFKTAMNVARHADGFFDDIEHFEVREITYNQTWRVEQEWQ
jgi:hypothetical protein